MVWLAVCLAVLGAFFLAIGAQRQGSAVKADTGGLALSSNGFLRLLRNPRIRAADLGEFGFRSFTRKREPGKSNY